MCERISSVLQQLHRRVHVKNIHSSASVGMATGENLAQQLSLIDPDHGSDLILNADISSEEEDGVG